MTRAMVPFTGRFFDDFRREMDSLLTRFTQGEDGGRELAFWYPSVNVAESEKAYEVTLDLPGLKPEDVTVELKQNRLWITGERKEEKEEKGKTWHRVERQSGQFRRVLDLPDDVDPNEVNAEFKDGVLHVTIAKTERARPQRITVKG